MIQQLIDFIHHNEAVGTTSKVSDMANESTGFLVVATRAEAQRRAHYAKNATVVSIVELLQDESHWQWNTKDPGPVFFDPKAVLYLVELLKGRLDADRG